MIQNQLTFCTAAMNDVIAYIDTAHDSVTIVEPPSTAHKAINYYQLFEEIKSVLTVQKTHTLYLCVRVCILKTLARSVLVFSYAINKRLL